MICCIARSVSFCSLRSRVALFLAVVVCLPKLAEAQVHQHGSGLPHNVPDFCAQATNSSLGSGSWSDASIWSAGHAPSAGEIISVSPGTSVTYDVNSTTEIACIGVRGRLQFRTDAATKLVVKTLMVLEGGELQVGTTDSPVTASAEIVIADRAPNTTTDPEQYGTGLIVFGKLRMHGSAKSSFSRLTSEVAAGATSLAISSSGPGWRAGDTVVLPDSHQWAPATRTESWQYEKVTIASASGSSVSLAQALRYAHRGARDTAGVLKALPHVGNLTRNVTIRSANANGTRGHVIMIYRADIDVRYVAFVDLGRTTIQNLNSTTFASDGSVTRVGTNQIGRYPAHFHHVFGPTSSQPNGYQFTFIGNAIVGSPKWGVAVHNSHYGLVQDNVVFGAAGAGIVTEDGSETQNVIERNFIVWTPGTGDDRGDGRAYANDWGWEGSGLWLRGTNNTIRNNVIANSMSFGVTFMVMMPSGRIPSSKGADPSVSGQTVNMQAVAVREFTGNEIYGAPLGLTMWNVGAACCTQVYDSVGESLVRETTLWHIAKRGFYGYGTNKITFDGWRHYGDRSVLWNPHEGPVSLFFGDYIARNTVMRRGRIEGLRTGVYAPSKVGDTRDPYGNTPGTFWLEDSDLRNVTNVTAENQWGVTGGGVGLPPRVITIKNVRFGSVPGDVGGVPQVNIEKTFRTDMPNPNYFVSDRIIVDDYNGTAGDDFEVFGRAQAGSFVIPSNAGSPLGGLTNATALSRYGVAIHAAITPCATTRSGIGGNVCAPVTPVTGTPPPPPPPPPPPTTTEPPPPTTTEPPPPTTTEPPPPTTTPPPPTSTPEQCGDEVDNDGDGQVDEGCPTQPDHTSVLGDFDGDRKADITVYRRSNGVWYTLHSGTNYSTSASRSWGEAQDIPVTGDFDGDKKADVGVFRPSVGYWYVLTSSSGFATTLSRQYGAPGDVPVPADYDGDGKTDMAVFRVSTGRWYILTSSSDFTGALGRLWGTRNDVPVPADFDGDGKADLAVYRPSTGTWYILRSSTNNVRSTSFRHGVAVGNPVPADYDGDGKADIAFFRPLVGWSVLTSSSNQTKEIFVRWGYREDVPIPADHDGDGKADIAIFRPATGGWYLYKSSTGFKNGVLIPNWGQAGDVPMPSNGR